MARLSDIYNKNKTAKEAAKAKAAASAPKLPEPAIDTAPKASGHRSDIPSAPAASIPAETAKETALPLSSPHEMDLLAKECTERREFESTTHIILEGTAPRIQFGKTITRETLLLAKATPEEGDFGGDSNLEGLNPYIINIAKRPKQMKGHLSVVGAKETKKSHDDAAQATLYEMVFDALAQTKSFGMPEDAGPLVDVDGVMKMYADALFQGSVPVGAPEYLLDCIERVIDSRPIVIPRLESIEPRLFQGQYHVYDEGVETPDDPINASLILTTASRIKQDEVSNAISLSIVHPWEPYLIGVAALRSRGIPAYLGQALVPYRLGEEVPDYLERDALLYRAGKSVALAAPIIAIIDPAADVAMRVFRMSRLFPQFGAIDILSDTAVDGAAFAIRAESRIKHLAFEMIRRGQESREPLSEAEYQLALKRIARCLFQSIKRWDGNPLVTRALSGVEGGVQEGAFTFQMAKFAEVNSSDNTVEVAEVGRQLLQMDKPEMFAPQDEIQVAAKQIAVFARTAGKEAAKTMQMTLGAWIKKADLNKAG